MTTTTTAAKLFDELPPEVRARVVPLWQGRGTPALFSDEAARLRANPTRWLHVSTESTEFDADEASRLAAKIRNGGLRAFKPKHTFDAVHTNDGQVWARYVGDQS